MLETPALCVCASPRSPLIPVSPCLTLGLETDHSDEFCHKLMGWDGTRLERIWEGAVITITFCSCGM